jgi:hypothetical protein
VYSGGGADFYQRPASQAGYYGPPGGAMVPAAALGAAYGAGRNESPERERSMSDSDSERRRRRRHRHKDSNRDDHGSRSRTRDLATAGLAAGAAGLAASEHEKRKQRRREERRERKRTLAHHDSGSTLTDFWAGQEAEQQRAYQDLEAGQGPYAPHSQRQSGGTPAGYPPDNYYPPTNSFPPPPNPGYGATPGYNSADYPPPPGPQPAGQIHPDYGYQSPQSFPPPPGGPYTPASADPYGPPGNVPRRGDENVSAQPLSNNTFGVPAVPEHRVEEGGWLVWLLILRISMQSNQATDVSFS